MHTIIDSSIDVLDRSRHSNPKVEFAEDVRRGLLCNPKELSPKYFYDERGSELFEEITGLQEYYQTRTERALLQKISSLIAEKKFQELVELGSGSSAKTRVLLDEMTTRESLKRYVPIDVSRDFLVLTAEQLGADYPMLRINPVVGDFLDGLDGITCQGPMLVLFLGGTIGNLYRTQSVSFLSKVASGMKEGDAFLMGIDLFKDPALLHAAYNDNKGITEQFNRNILHVINRELNGEFDPASFYHYAHYNADDMRIEMRLVSGTEQSVRIGDLDLEVHFEEGEGILTEISRKFTRASATRLLADAGMKLVEWWSDDNDMFGLVLAQKKGEGE